MKTTQLKNGGDPRALPDYASLCNEISKLAHPARPDVNWQYVETLCLRLFEHNGVELQTAAWYTLSRTHSQGLPGMNEGLALLNALTVHHWSVMWPPGSHARTEILAGLVQRMQHVFRTLMLDDRDLLPPLYQSEKQLIALSDTLARHALKQAARLDYLQHQVRQAIIRLENRPHDQLHDHEIVLPAQALDAPQSAVSAPPVYVVSYDPLRQGQALTRETRRFWPFMSGAVSAVLVGAVMLWGWQVFSTPRPAEQQLTASLTPLPPPLTSAQLADLRQHGSLQDRAALVAQMAEQLSWLSALPPDWASGYGQRLLSQAQVLWPDHPDVVTMQQAWQSQLAQHVLPAASLQGWHEGMATLQQLAARLNALDEKRGQYLTVSELKSQVFTIINHLRQAVPAEEQLRLIQLHSEDSPLREQQIQTLERQLRAQIDTLVREKEYGATKQE